MTDLIKVNYDNADRPTVSGRELHTALGIETPYHKWFPRMCEYGFSEEKDFWTKMSKSPLHLLRQSSYSPSQRYGSGG